MKNQNLRIIIVWALASVLGVIIVQTYWFISAFDLKEKQFSHNVFVALQKTAESLYAYHNLPVPLESLVTQVSVNYYVVAVNSEIPTSILELYLIKEFEKLNILADFEYGIYNCSSRKMLYGNYVSHRNTKKEIKRNELPVWKNDSYYFGVYFPDKNSEVINQMGKWLFFSCLLLVVCFFFVYTMVVILKQKRLSDIQKDFINNMTHEFKTPISTIQITCDLIDKPEVLKNSELVSNYNSIIRKEAYRLKEHVDRVLEIAFMEKGKVKYNIAQIHLHHCIDIAVKSITVLLENKKGNILLQLDALYDEIYGDEAHIVNVIFNLLDNAIKYSINAPYIKVMTKNIDNEIYISIIDNGIGIATENRKKIFDKFYRVPTGNIHNVKGFGLGLFYVHTIIKLHKGKVVVNSNFPVGTEFLIRLPLGRKKL